MENQEQKLKLVGILEDQGSSSVEDQEDQEDQKIPTLPDMIITPLAPPYQVMIPFHYEFLEKKFGEYWKENEEALIANFKVKGKKTKGGKQPNARAMVEKKVPIDKLYAQVLFNLIEENVDRDIMFIEGFKLFDYSPDGNTHMVAILYFTPDLVMGDEIDFKCIRTGIPTEEKEWENRCKELQRQHRTLTKVEGENIKIQSEHNVLMDMLVKVDGKEYDKASLKGQWLEIEVIRIPELKDALLQHECGDQFEVDFKIPVQDPTHGGEAAIGTITVYELQKIEYPDIDDGLAKDADFESLAKFREKFSEDFGKYLENAERARATDHVLNQIMRGSKVPPVPQEWLDKSIDNMIKEHMKHYPDDRKKAMQAVGIDIKAADSEAQFYDRFRGNVYREYMQSLAVRHYGKLYGVEPGTDEMFKDILSRIDWLEEVEVPDVKKA